MVDNVCSIEQFLLKNVTDETEKICSACKNAQKLSQQLPGATLLEEKQTVHHREKWLQI
jgi:hypothetical protein